MKKLVVMLLGVFLVVSLAGCGGGGGDDEQMGEPMERETLDTRYEEVNEVHISAQTGQ